MAKTSVQKIYKEIEFNERRLLLLLSNDLLWFRKNLENIKSSKNKKAFIKKKSERYNQIFNTTNELSKLSDKLTNSDSTILTSPYVYLEQEKLNAQKVKIKSDVKIKNLSKPKLFEVIVFTHFVDLFNNPKSRKYPKEKCIKIVAKKILDKGNNMPSSKYARDYFLSNQQDALNIISRMFVDSALYLKRDIESEMQKTNIKKKQKAQEKAIEEHTTLTRAKNHTDVQKKAATHKTPKAQTTQTNIFENISIEPTKSATTKTSTSTRKPKIRYNSITNTYEHIHEEEDDEITA